MKKTCVFAIVIISILILSALLLCACDDAPSQRELANECIRIHIRANSNSDYDQAVKLKVRDAITAYLTEKLDECKSKQEAKIVLEKEKANLVKIANNTLYANDFEYKASIALKTSIFPTENTTDTTSPKATMTHL